MADSEGQYGFPDDGADDDQSIISVCSKAASCTPAWHEDPKDPG
jgi:hypothetical protein